MRSPDTIVALSTPPGRSGIGVIRLSGPRSLDYVKTLLRNADFSPEPNRVSLQTLRAPASDEVLDRALVTYFKAPHSFTGEDVVELSCHGSPVLLLHVIDALLSLGARAADPGEFTLRALSNGRLNLSQAEAVRDLIDAQTDAAVRQAARQLGGELSARLQPFKDALVELIVPLESSLEFVEDDLPQVALERISHRLQELIQNLESLSETFRSGRLLKEGIKVALVGRPNVGKSSVFNKLLASDRAIVTDIAGTTRDSLSELLSIEGIPILLTDTAGVHKAGDRIERLGIERTRRAIADADLVVIVIDGSQPLTPEDDAVFAEVIETKRFIVINKCDLETFDEGRLNGLNDGIEYVTVSAMTGEGFESLRHAILKPFSDKGTQEAGFLITNARHFDLLCRAATSLRSSQMVINQGASEDLIVVGLYDALRFLGEITGETTPEDILSEIFATFCIG
ncbi:MAG TPA: tRNA uridine-5-carboxymethylaminomethyl(34) synthesis GTPase MnmE, partial [Pyrinomonadaceae bacterium]